MLVGKLRTRYIIRAHIFLKNSSATKGPLRGIGAGLLFESQEERCNDLFLRGHSVRASAVEVGLRNYTATLDGL